MRIVIALISYLLVHQDLLAAMREREMKGACYIQFEIVDQRTFDTLCEDLMTYRQCMSLVHDLEEEPSSTEISMTYSWLRKQRCKAVESN